MTTVEANKNNNKWIWIGLGAAALFCLCAIGVAAFVVLRMGQQFKQGVKTDPQAASEAGHTIADYELPAGYQEKAAMDFFMYSMVLIAPESIGSGSLEAKPIIMLTQFRMMTNPQQMEEQMRRAFEQQSGRRGVAMKVVEVRKLTIRGEEVEVTTLEGTDDKGFAMRQLITTFPGKQGTAMLMIMGAAQTWDKEEIDHFVESIH